MRPPCKPEGEGGIGSEIGRKEGGGRERAKHVQDTKVKRNGIPRHSDLLTGLLPDTVYDSDVRKTSHHDIQP
jgi:hypothetical protein